ncbi:copper resistance protein CopC [Streptomyces sp. 110]|uniref:Copper resistance protein CopC n=1 Tax=Streptomyces endocoffeicus TaxID=2898945 RepID=A0ABS1PHB4_9ACTN|nr:copper resistance CopC family protein [Streptomyces endocoffeicus]MBL1111400.1 copper resistance protein CopC [Streptomyces endocoffeicus]
MFTTHLPRAAAVGGLLACATLIATARPAAAHTALTGSAPDDGATVATSPDQVSLSFNDPMDARYSRVAVTGSSGRAVTTGAPEVEGRTVTQALAADTPPGRYTVGYRVVSADGHPVSGRFGFTVAALRTTSPAPRASTSSSDAPAASAGTAKDESSAPGALPVVAGAAIVLAGGGGIAYLTHKRRSRHGG